MWKKGGPSCRNNPCCPLAVTEDEHVVHLIFDYHSGGDPLPCTNERAMSKDIAWAALKEEAEAAKMMEKKYLWVKLLGGDPFGRFDDLKKLCEDAWESEEKLELPVGFEIKTSFENMGEEQQKWYAANQGKLNLWLRSSELQEEEMAFAIQYDCGMAYVVSPMAAEKAYADLEQMLKMYIPVRIERKDLPGGWGKKEREQYYRLIDQLQKLPGSYQIKWADDIKRMVDVQLGIGTENVLSGRCYDTNGYAWTCPAVSHLKLHSWSMEQDRLDEIIFHEEGKSPLDWVCPAEILRWGDTMAIHNIALKERFCGILGLQHLPERPYQQFIEQLLEARDKTK